MSPGVRRPVSFEAKISTCQDLHGSCFDHNIHCITCSVLTKKDITGYDTAEHTIYDMCSPEELSRSRAQGQTARRWPEAHIPCQLLISPDVYSVERTPARSLEWLGRAFECISLASRRSQAAMLQEAVASILECTVLQECATSKCSPLCLCVL